MSGGISGNFCGFGILTAFSFEHSEAHENRAFQAQNAVFRPAARGYLFSSAKTPRFLTNSCKTIGTVSAH